MKRMSCCVSIVLALAVPALADDIARDAESERQAFQVADGFEVNLFASEPAIANPIQMTFDPSGRLWVICSYAYPHVTPGKEADDKVIVLEDTNADGRAEKATVFAGGLLVPTGIELGDGGVYVSNQPDLLFLKDTDGDGKADFKRVLLSGFGTEDNHHAIHTFRWAPGGKLHFQSGTFLHNQVETPYGVVSLENGGVWQFEPRAMKLELYVHHGFLNPWGHVFDRWGQDFLTEAPGGGIFYLTPGEVRAHATGPYPSINGPPKSCGVEFISGRHMPESMQGVMVLNAFKNKVVNLYRFSDDGSGYAAKELPPLIVSREDSFRPVDVKMGPDGAIYIADWYNPIIGHMQYNFRDPRRDASHGRIWRITAKGRPLVQRPQLVGQPIEALLDGLKAPEDYTRHQVRRLLYDMEAKTVAPALAAWVGALDPSDPELEHHRLEALWAYQTINVVEPELLKSMLRARDPRARAAATRVLRYWHEQISDPFDLLAALVADEHPRVRLEAVVALSYIADPQSIELATRVLDRPMDRYLDSALQLMANGLKAVWLSALEAGRLSFDGNVRHQEFALQAVQSPGVVKPLLSLLKQGKIPADRRGNVAELIAAVGGPDDLRAVYPSEEGGLSFASQAMVLTAMARSARERGVTPSGDLTPIKALFNHKDERLRDEAIRLAGAWKLESLRPDVAGIAEARESSPRERRAAIDALVELGGPASISMLGRLCGDDRPQPVRLMGTVGLAALDLKAAAARAVEVLASGRNEATVTAIFTAFFQRKGGSDILSAALSATMLHPDVAKLGLRSLYSAGRQDPGLVEVLNKAAGVHPNPDQRSLSADGLARIVADVQQKGDPARGERIFRSRRLGCFQCHAIAGAGGQVGPDLSGLGASSPVDYLIESILLPTKAVREGFVSLIVGTDRGELFTGVKVREDKATLVLRDATHDEIVIPIDRIEDRKDAGSIMPAGLADLLTSDEFVDLVRFLSELGKPGAYNTPNLPIMRRWRVLDPVPNDLDTRGVQGLGMTLTTDERLSWRPAHSLVSGVLPVEDMRTTESQTVAFVQGQVEITTPGKIHLRLNSAKGLTLWVDGTQAALKDDLELDLERGVRTLTFRVDLEARGNDAGLRLELDDVPGSPGRFQVVGGR
jgi:putative heme-binding domain-containing protein